MRFFVVLIIIIFSSCHVSKRNREKHTPSPPDYSKNFYWSALPFTKDSADLIVPNSGLKDGQANAKADVFYIHPTNYLHGKKWNADLNDTTIRNRTDHLAAKFQASAFNGSCRVYLPRYRTAKFSSYFTTEPRKQEIFNLAYEDIKKAFMYYLENYNNGRPFIIASHSQGSDHALRLCHEFFDKDSVLNKQLVAIYIPGTLVFKTTFKTLKPCEDSLQTGCYVTWNSVQYGEILYLGKPIKDVVCVNPLTWTRTTEQAPSSLNKGSLPFSFDRIENNVADARIGLTGLLWVHKPDKSKKEYPRINTRSYHILDYNLFYMNIRENAEQRIRSYFNKK